MQFSNMDQFDEDVKCILNTRIIKNISPKAARIVQVLYYKYKDINLKYDKMKQIQQSVNFTISGQLMQIRK